MATMNASEVGVGAAKATGAIYVAATTTSLPASASASISSYTLLGFTSEDGVTISEETNTDQIKAWEGRTTVYNVVTEYTESISFTPIQCNGDVAKLMWGNDAVTVGVDGSLAITHTGATLEPIHIVIDTVPREGLIKRYTGKAQLVERGEQTLNGTQVEGRQLTFNMLPDSYGVTLYEYQEAVSES